MNFLYNNFIILIIFLFVFLLALIWLLVHSFKESKITSFKIISVDDTNSIQDKSLFANEESSIPDALTQEEPVMQMENTEPVLSEELSQNVNNNFLSNYCQEKARRNKSEKGLFIIGAVGICLLIIVLTYYVLNFCTRFIK